MRERATFSRRALAAALPIAALVAMPAAALPKLATAAADPVLEQIAGHRALRIAITRTSGRDDDPAYEAACDAEEAALQALGDALPTSIAGAAALLAYMAEVEGDFADDGSPLLRTVLSVAAGLINIGGSHA